jgi:glutaredoxin 3
MASEHLVLYVKTWCPWCIRAKSVLDSQGYKYEQVDVEASKASYDEMIRLSGQRLTPTLVVGEKVLPDFGPDELVAFLEKHQIMP